MDQTLTTLDAIASIMVFIGRLAICVHAVALVRTSGNTFEDYLRFFALCAAVALTAMR